MFRFRPIPEYHTALKNFGKKKTDHLKGLFFCSCGPTSNQTLSFILEFRFLKVFYNESICIKFKFSNVLLVYKLLWILSSYIYQEDQLKTPPHTHLDFDDF